MTIGSSASPRTPACHPAVPFGAACLIAATLMPLPAAAAGIVGTGTPQSCTEAALSAAVAGGGLVTFDCGAAPHTIALSGGASYALNFSLATEIDGNGLITLSAGNAKAIASVFPGTSVTLRGLTLRDGQLDGGGCLANSGTLQLEGVTITACTSGSGGGAIANAGLLLIRDSQIVGNQAQQGAAIASPSGLTVAWRTRFADNHANSTGGALDVSGDADFAAEDCVFEGNSAGAGSAVLALSSSQATALFYRSRIEGNGPGFHILSATGQLTIDRSAIVSNTGGIPVTSSGATFVNDTTVTGNASFGSTRGALDVFGNGALSVRHSTVYGNAGKGINVFAPATAGIANTLVAANTIADCSGVLDSAGGNLDGDGSCQLSEADDLPATDPLLGPPTLATHGDANSTTWILPPLPGSPLIDGGRDTTPAFADQVGTQRPVDGDGDGSASPDIGAIEYVTVALFGSGFED